MRWRAAAARLSAARTPLLATLLAALPMGAAADVVIRPCSERLENEGYNASEALSHLPEIMHYEFTETGRGSLWLAFLILAPDWMFTDLETCTWIRAIERQPNGSFTGLLQRRNRVRFHGPSFVVQEEIAFQADQIIDWQLVANPHDTRVFGSFLTRHRTEIGLLNSTEAMHLMPETVPRWWSFGVEILDFD